MRSFFFCFRAKLRTIHGAARIAAQTAQRMELTGPEGRKRHRPVTKTLSRAMGRMNFQAKPISWSMRRRGSVPRIQMKKKMSASSFAKNHIHDGIKLRTESGADHPPRKSVMPSAEVANMPRYSARKKSANLKPEYAMK